jgi:hypothetical protein
LVHNAFIWYILYCFGIMYQEKSGNPAQLRFVCTSRDFFAIKYLRKIILQILLDTSLRNVQLVP